MTIKGYGETCVAKGWIRRVMSPDADANKTFDVPSDSLVYCSPLSRKTHLGACNILLQGNAYQNIWYRITDTCVPLKFPQWTNKCLINSAFWSLKKHMIKIYPSNLKTKIKKKYK